MSITVAAGSIVGATAELVDVEVDMLRRLPSVTIVGMPSHAVRESTERVRSSLNALGYEFPKKRVVINLAPADIPKQGASFDLPIALGILAATGVVSPQSLNDTMFAGELSLNGGLRDVRGAIALATLARRLGKNLLLPDQVAAEAAMVPGVTIFGASDLGEVVRHLRGEEPLQVQRAGVAPVAHSGELDLSDVAGQRLAKYALEVAAAGHHHVLLTGPPGCGKTMLAERLPGILPPLTEHQRVDVAQIYSVAGLEPPGGHGAIGRPFRSPHHSVSTAGLSGSRHMRPGEMSLAHHGVLFLDEAPEFSRSALELLREPLQDGEFRLARSAGSVVWPARFLLVLAQNPCPCGMYGSGQPCLCPANRLDRYRQKVAGPLLDRIDLRVQLSASSAGLFESAWGREECSSVVKARVLQARERQATRGQAAPNGVLPSNDLRQVCNLSTEAREVLIRGERMESLSVRGVTRVLAVARTIADLNAQNDVLAEHVHISLGLRGGSTSSQLGHGISRVQTEHKGDVYGV